MAGLKSRPSDLPPVLYQDKAVLRCRARCQDTAARPCLRVGGDPTPPANDGGLKTAATKPCRQADAVSVDDLTSKPALSLNRLSAARRPPWCLGVVRSRGPVRDSWRLALAGHLDSRRLRAVSRRSWRRSANRSGGRRDESGASNERRPSIGRSWLSLSSVN